MRRAILLAPPVAFLLASLAPAHAQQSPPQDPAAAPVAPTVRWFDPLKLGDTLGPSGAGGGPSGAIFEPLRIGLLARAVPRGATEPGCTDALPAAGSATASAPGFAPQYASAVRLVPHLTLYGFSRGGCAVDGALGAGAVAPFAIARRTWLVGSAGVSLLPQNGPAGSSVTRSHASVDLLFERPSGRTVTVGVSTRGLTVGGNF